MPKNIKINGLPFYWRLKDISSKNLDSISTNYNFEFDYISSYELLIQKRDKKILKALKKIYLEEYNIGYLQEGYEIAQNYGIDFLEYIKKNLSKRNIKKILEIGCGGCIILENLKNMGYDVMGIDSNPSSETIGNKKNIKVINDFFPSSKLSFNFDLIYHSDVLEHIDDFETFLKHHYDLLNNNGLIIVNVPDNTENYEIGDISMAMHQHLNYFTKSSLKLTLEKNNFQIIDIRKAGYGGSLYATAKKSTKKNNYLSDSNILNYNQFNNNFFNKIITVRKLISNIINKNKSFGFYVPLRALPYIFYLNINHKFRFFDDTSHWHQREFDGIKIKIENFEDLKRNPVDCIFIISLTFDNIIEEKIKNYYENIKIIKLRDMLSIKPD